MRDLKNCRKILKSDFFRRDAVLVAKELVGKVLGIESAGGELLFEIVETEAYAGINDRAAHSFGGRRTKRNETMYKDAAHVYVYMTYGIHFMLNIVTSFIDDPQAVLIRALRPLGEYDEISLNRFNKNYAQLSKKERISLTNGPGKLTSALGIDRSLDGTALGERIFIYDCVNEVEIISSKRIGIDYAKEAIEYPYRFYSAESPYVSRR